MQPQMYLNCWKNIRFFFFFFFFFPCSVLSRSYFQMKRHGFIYVGDADTRVGARMWEQRKSDAVVPRWNKTD